MIFVERIKHLREEWKLPQRKLAVVMDIDTTSAPLIEENKNKTRNKKYASDNLFVINSLVSLSCVYLRVMCHMRKCSAIGKRKRQSVVNKYGETQKNE